MWQMGSKLDMTVLEKYVTTWMARDCHQCSFIRLRAHQPDSQSRLAGVLCSLREIPGYHVYCGMLCAWTSLHHTVSSYETASVRVCSESRAVMSSMD